MYSTRCFFLPDLKPRVAVTLLPGLPAYILFMMLRHMDHVDDEPKMHQLMKAVRTGVKKTLKKRADSVEYNALWLSNMLRSVRTGFDRFPAARTGFDRVRCAVPKSLMVLH